MHCPTPIFSREPPDTAPFQNAQDPFISARFLVYTPGYIPEVVRVALRAPCVLRALRTVQRARHAERRHKFLELVVVNPQPKREYGTLLALPTWVRQLTVVLFDCSSYNDTVFSTTVASVLRREDMLVIAGLGSGAQVLVFVGQSPQALLPQQPVQLATGDVITIAWHGTPIGTGISLAAMLFSPLGWDDGVRIPGQHNPGFCVLTDTMPERFPLASFQRLRFRQDLAYYLQWPLAELTVRPAVPRIRDHMDLGWFSTAVLVATRQVTRPTSRPPRQYVVILRSQTHPQWPRVAAF